MKLKKNNKPPACIDRDDIGRLFMNSRDVNDYAVDQNLVNEVFLTLE